MVAYRMIAAAVPVLVAMSAIATPAPSNLIQGLLTKRAAIDPTVIPDQCKDQCTGIVNELNSCNSSIACLCTNSNMDGIAVCYDCVASISGSSTDVETAQANADQITAECKVAGSPVKSVTISPKKNSAIRSDVLNLGAIIVALATTLVLA
ncbi:hypothetical protein C0991_003603 [Blastosporella zonata]|nr:hypothetical protein C0991_003603 [Blastosporella zonata]